MANNKNDLCNENHYMKLQSLALKLKCEIIMKQGLMTKILLLLLIII